MTKSSFISLTTIVGCVIISSVYADSPLQVYDSKYNYNYCQATFPELDSYPNPRIHGSTLLNVQLFHRHGDRTPVKIRPQDNDLVWDCDWDDSMDNSLYKERNQRIRHNRDLFVRTGDRIPSSSSPFSAYMWKGGCAPGQLTSLGAQQLQQLGENLREIYIDRLKLLPDIFDSNTVYLRSTAVRRAKESAENLMMGLYGTDDEVIDETFLQLRDHSLPSNIDYMTMNTKQCPRITQLRNKISKNSNVVRMLEETQGDYQDDVNSIIGTNNLNYKDLVDTIFPRICHNLPLQCHPENQERCITLEIADRCLSYASQQVAEAQQNLKDVQEMLQLGIGPLTRDILTNIMNAKGNKTVPFLLYSGHDTTISPLLGMLGSSDMRWPPYASNLLFELWQSPTSDFFVRVLYNGYILKTINGWCDLEWCPLDNFTKHLSQYVVDDLRVKCRKTSTRN